MKTAITTFLLLLWFGFDAHTQQGRLLLVGGGSEKNGANGWSVPAYRWAAEGKRVAVIGASTGSLANYLTQYCGAAFAREFGVASRDSADSQVLYDSLKTYQVIFFRGGDQYDYYRFYKNTKLQQLAEELFAQGGTLAGTSAGMHILSSVIFSAQNGTVYPYEAIENPNNSYMTLEDDFFSLFPGYIFDTHFSERARFARLAGFLAKYQFDHGQNLTGLGMDDMTCMTIDENRLGTVYGTGCANFFNFNEPFLLNNNKLIHPGIRLTQLIQGCTYDFNTGAITTPTLDRYLQTSLLEETGDFILLASGGNTVSNNTAMLGNLVSQCGTPDDPVLLLSGNENTAQLFKNQLIQHGAPQIDVFLLNQANGNNLQLAEKINSAVKILFVDNATDDLNTFLTTSNGQLLEQRLKKRGMIAAFAGDDARFAGKTVVDNFYTELASWYGELEFSRGLGMLQHSMLMTNTYFHADIYENTATAVPYAMAIDTLRYGIWLTAKNYLKIMPLDGKTTLLGYGQHPVMILRNEGGMAGLVTQTGSGSSSAVPRMEAGFDQLTLSFTDESQPYLMGTTDASDVPESTLKSKVILLQNPAIAQLQLKLDIYPCNWQISDLKGQLLSQGKAYTNFTNIPIDWLAPGPYVVHLHDLSSGESFSVKFIKL